MDAQIDIGGTQALSKMELHITSAFTPGLRAYCGINWNIGMTHRPTTQTDIGASYLGSKFTPISRVDRKVSLVNHVVRTDLQMRTQTGHTVNVHGGDKG